MTFSSIYRRLASNQTRLVVPTIFFSSTNDMVNLINFENRRCEKWKWYSPSLFRPSIYIKWQVFPTLLYMCQSEKRHTHTKLQPVVLISCHVDVSWWHWAVIYESKTQNEILLFVSLFCVWIYKISLVINALAGFSLW